MKRLGLGIITLIVSGGQKASSITRSYTIISVMYMIDVGGARDAQLIRNNDPG